MMLALVIFIFVWTYLFIFAGQSTLFLGCEDMIAQHVHVIPSTHFGEYDLT